MSETQRDGSEMRCKRCGANECRIHGFCSVECEHYFDYEEEITDLEARIAELEEEQVILKDQMREATNFLIDKKLHVDSLYEDGFKLQKRIAELEAAQRWRVVADGELPDDDVEVFVLLYGSSVSTGKHYRNARHLDLEDNSYNLNYVIGDYWLIGDDETTCAQHCYNAVTHWMPLPELPEVRE